MKVCLHQTQQSSCIRGGLTVSMDGMPRPQHPTQTTLDRVNSTTPRSVKNSNSKRVKKRKNPKFVWLKILFFLFFKQRMAFGSWRFAAPGVCLDWRYVSQLWDTVGQQKIMEIGSVLKDTQWLHKHLTAAEQEVLLCWTFCLSFIFPFHKYRLETSPWKAEGNLVDCKHGGEEELFRMVKRV